MTQLASFLAGSAGPAARAASNSAVAAPSPTMIAASYGERPSSPTYRARRAAGSSGKDARIASRYAGARWSGGRSGSGK